MFLGKQFNFERIEQFSRQLTVNPCEDLYLVESIKKDNLAAAACTRVSRIDWTIIPTPH